jgi:glutamyl-tRNA synthetase
MFKLFKKKEKIITRLAPSPTGKFHIGTARTALFNYIFAKQNNGKFLLRIEDTDKERSKKEFEEDILNGLDWLGLKYDEMYRQSERVEIHKEYLVKMISEGKAYVSEEKEGDRKEVIRFKNPNKEITFDDIIRGEIKFNTKELGDFVIAKSENEPLFHLAVVVDDHDMGITHNIRGEDHISNTQRQILIQEAIGAKRPKYAHLPLILGEDKSKLSKRHGATSLTQFKEEGYKKEALVNFLAFLGWNPGTEKEIFSMEELIKEFSLEKVGKGGAVFNKEKLDWYNKQYLEKINDEEYIESIKPLFSKFDTNDDFLLKLRPVILDRVSKFSEVEEMINEGDLDYLFNLPLYEVEKLMWKKTEKIEDTLEYLEEVLSRIEKINTDFNRDIIKESVWDYADEKGRGDVLWPFRYSLSGKDKSPDPFELAEILGKEESISRVKKAISLINE